MSTPSDPKDQSGAEPSDAVERRTRELSGVISTLARLRPEHLWEIEES